MSREKCLDNAVLASVRPKPENSDLARSVPLRTAGNLTPAVHVTVALVAAVTIAVLASHLAANWLGLSKAAMAYRRIGVPTGPQVFCAGSSVVQFGLSWPEIADALGQGIENWGTAGSTPSEWEMSQGMVPDTNLMIMGISIHDLNENFLCDAHANIVPLKRSIDDIWTSNAGWQLSRRILSQYPLAYIRALFPTAGKSDAVLVGLRRKVQELIESPSVADKDNFLVLPSEPVLKFGDTFEKVSDWPPGKALRRLDLLRNEIHGSHRFDGPKRLAVKRMLERADRNGRIIVVVAPVAPLYKRNLVTPDVRRKFENAIQDIRLAAPRARILRFDDMPALDSDEYYSDFVHLNSAGRRILTAAFLKELRKGAEVP